MMMTPGQLIDYLKSHCKQKWKIAFISAFLIGMLVHMSVLLSDIPNHDGLDSMYFNQNMITSGRWFLMVACGFSSYFTIPWVIGVLGLFFLGLTAVVLTELLDIQDNVTVVLISGLLTTFPALTSTFAYVYTLDGYMLAMLLSVLAVLLCKKYGKGFIPGGLCLGFSLGIYQAYLPFAMILCMYMVICICLENLSIKEKAKQIFRFLYMGMIGVAFYYIMLQILLKIQGKQLASYQGINGADNGNIGLLQKIYTAYRDFAAFLIKGKILFNDVISFGAVLLLIASVLLCLFGLCKKRKLWKKWQFFVIIGLLLCSLPMVSNYILIVSPMVNYHLLMRYHFVLFLILGIAFVDKYLEKGKGKWIVVTNWCAVLGVGILVFHFAVTDNIAYSNLQKKYEKTYAYCMRLLDRIEQTEGYYQGIPIAMIGVVGDEQFPTTDISGKVTDHMIGMNGDSLLYTGENYEKFMKHYLGATLNILPPEAMETFYYSEEYQAMDSFPGQNSVKIVDGILYIKTENTQK